MRLGAGFGPQAREYIRGRWSFILFTGASLTLQVSTLLCSFLALKKVGPAQMGIWQTLLLIQGYLFISRLGIINAMNREFPFFLGAGKPEEARQVVATAQAYTLANGLVLALVFLALGLTHWQQGPDWRCGFLVMILVTPMELWSNLLESTFRGSQEFIRLGYVQLIMAGAQWVSFLLVIFFGFMGWLAREVLLRSLALTLYCLARPVKAPVSFRWETFKLLFSTGWRLFVANYLILVSDLFPRLFLVSWSGVAAVGLFTPVTGVRSAFQMFVSAVAIYVYPRLTFQYAQGRPGTGRRALRWGALTGMALLPAAAGAFFLLPVLIERFLPQYVPAIPAVRIAALVGLLECMRVGMTAFFATKAWTALFTYAGCSLLVRASSALIGYWSFQDRLLGITLGMLVGSAVMFGVTWALGRTLDRSPGTLTQEAEAADAAV
jgi:O-antigen/teichoic acid export membrane protein